MVEGYGSNLMSKAASYIYAVDIDETTIQAAKIKYNNKSTEFINCLEVA